MWRLRLARALQPIAITLDVLMPGMDGWAVIAGLKADPTLADIPVVLITIMDNPDLGYSLGITEHLTKPVLAYIAGFSAPPGKTMGHAGAIISGSSGTAAAKKEALEARGIEVGTTPTEVAQLVAARMKSSG